MRRGCDTPVVRRRREDVKAGRELRPREPHSEARAGSPRQVLRRGASGMKFGDQADNVEAQAEMRTTVTLAAAPTPRLPEGLEESSVRLWGDGWPRVVDLEHRQVGFESEP